MDGYCGHCLRAYNYWPEYFPNLSLDPEQINSISVTHNDIRQESKAPTFLLTYGGSYHGLMNNLGWSEEKAKNIESAYHEMYQVSDQWVQSKLEQASKDGYVTVAFGLRVRTPLLHQVVLGNSKTPYEASAEGRTAANSLGQSFGLLNSRAASEFMGKVRNSKFKYDIRPSSHIHDSSYYMIRDSIDPLLFLNKHLVEAVQWQELPDIQHDEVKLGGNTSVFFPSWAEELEIPNYIKKEDLEHLVQEYVTNLKEPK